MPHLRWLIIGLVFQATVINYLDRLTVSVLAPIITRDLGLTNLEFAQVGTWFLLAYTVSGVGSMLFTLATGWVVDHFSYTPIFTVAGLLGPIGTAVLFACSGRFERVRLHPAHQDSHAP